MTSVPPPPRYCTGTVDDGSAAGFAAVAAAHLGLAAALLAQPVAAADFILGPKLLAGWQPEQLLGLVASGLLAGASAAWATKEAADLGLLETPAPERLQLGLMAFGVAALAAHAAHAGDATHAGLRVGAAAAALTLGVPAARALGTERGRRHLGARIRGIPGAVRRFFDFRGGGQAPKVLYAALTPAFIAAGFAYAAAPSWALTNVLGYVVKGRDAQFLLRVAGGALLSVLPTMTATLKDKADAGRLSDPAARTLNVGLLAASAAQLAVLAPIYNDGVGGRYLPAALGVWGVAGAAALAGLAGGAADKA